MFLFECITLGWWEIAPGRLLPQVAETKLPQLMDVADPGLLYDLNG